MISRRQILFLGMAAFAEAYSGVAISDEEAWDVIVVGSGMAGFCAALSAKEEGAERVLMLEKGPLIGGHTLFSSGTIAAVVSEDSNFNGPYSDSAELFVQDALKTGGKKGDPDILRRLAEESSYGLDWLRTKGIVFGDSFQARAGLRKRSFAMLGNSAGRSYVMLLNHDRLEKNIPLNLRNEVIGLSLFSKGWALEVSTPFGRKIIKTRSVIFATGGSTADIARRKLFDPRLDENFQTSANPWGRNWDGAQGDALRIAERLGWAVTSGNGYQIVPFWGGRLLDYAGGDIYVNVEGRRFVDENRPWHEVTKILLDKKNPEFFVITDSQSRKGATLGVKLLSKIIMKSDSVEEMALAMRISPVNLKQTLTEYNKFVENGLDQNFGKRFFAQKINRAPYYWGREKLHIHTSLDGVKTDCDAQVLDKDGKRVDGVFAAGEVVGGIFGKDRLGGAALTNCLVMGRAAGTNAARFALGRKDG